MNKEATFALRFVMKDFAKMRKAVEQMNKNLEQMRKNANKASNSMNKLNTSMGNTLRSLSKFALGYFAISKIISTTFKKANETIQLDMMAQSAGVATEKIGKLGKALRIYGGDAKSAGSAYMSLTDIIGGAQHGMGISEEVQRVNAMYGIGFNYGNISQDALMTQIATRMHALRKEGDQWAINQIAKAYGIDTPMANFLAEQGANWSSKANRYKWERVSKSETQRLIEAQDNLETALAELGNILLENLPALVKGVTALVEYLTNMGTKKDKEGNIITRAGLVGDVVVPKEGYKNKEGYSVLANKSQFSMLDDWKSIQDKRLQEAKEFEDMKNKYESEVGQTFKRNWLTGNYQLDIDLTVEDKTQNGIKATEKSKSLNNKYVLQPTGMQ